MNDKDGFYLTYELLSFNMNYYFKNLLSVKSVLSLVLVLLTMAVIGQDQITIDNKKVNQSQVSNLVESLQHHHLAFILGMESSKYYLDNNGADNKVYVPTLGINYTYWLDDGLGFGIKSLVSLTEYQLSTSDTSSIQRNYPVSASLQILFNPLFGVLFTVGPGIEFEQHENLFIFNIGIGYRIKILDQFDMSPEFIYCLKNSHIDSFSLGVQFALRI